MTERDRRVLTESAFVLSVLSVHFATGVLPDWLAFACVVVFTFFAHGLYGRHLARKEREPSIPQACGPRPSLQAGDSAALNRPLKDEPALNRTREPAPRTRARA
ncbi:MAG TPA: hypothetical protein VGV38_19105 [Pyrinomonadaceae bacterium]|nr:hypothetical protein [Pyrinomonadaceae bacterium]